MKIASTEDPYVLHKNWKKHYQSIQKFYNKMKDDDKKDVIELKQKLVHLAIDLKLINEENDFAKSDPSNPCPLPNDPDLDNSVCAKYYLFLRDWSPNTTNLVEGEHHFLRFLIDTYTAQKKSIVILYEYVRLGFKKHKWDGPYKREILKILTMAGLNCNKRKGTKIPKIVLNGKVFKEWEPEKFQSEECQKCISDEQPCFCRIKMFAVFGQDICPHLAWFKVNNNQETAQTLRRLLERKIPVLRGVKLNDYPHKRIAHFKPIVRLEYNPEHKSMSKKYIKDVKTNISTSEICAILDKDDQKTKSSAQEEDQIQEERQEEDQAQEEDQIQEERQEKAQVQVQETTFETEQQNCLKFMYRAIVRALVQQSHDCIKESDRRRLEHVAVSFIRNIFKYNKDTNGIEYIPNHYLPLDITKDNIAQYTKGKMEKMAETAISSIILGKENNKKDDDLSYHLNEVKRIMDSLFTRKITNSRPLRNQNTIPFRNEFK